MHRRRWRLRQNRLARPQSPRRRVPRRPLFAAVQFALAIAARRAPLASSESPIASFIHHCPYDTATAPNPHPAMFRAQRRRLISHHPVCSALSVVQLLLPHALAADKARLRAHDAGVDQLQDCGCSVAITYSMSCVYHPTCLSLRYIGTNRIARPRWRGSVYAVAGHALLRGNRTGQPSAHDSSFTPSARTMRSKSSRLRYSITIRPRCLPRPGRICTRPPTACANCRSISDR